MIQFKEVMIGIEDYKAYNIFKNNVINNGVNLCGDVCECGFLCTFDGYDILVQLPYSLIDEIITIKEIMNIDEDCIKICMSYPNDEALDIIKSFINTYSSSDIR